MPALTKRALNEQILAAANPWGRITGPIDEVPLLVDVDGLGRFAMYAFTLTAPPGGRPVGEYKVQLILPGQGRGNRGRLEPPAGRFAVIVGWSREEEVFVLWDAYAHLSFAYSQNLQIKGDAVWLARTDGLHSWSRKLRGGRGVEEVIVCRSDRLQQGLVQRLQQSANRLSNLD